MTKSLLGQKVKKFGVYFDYEMDMYTFSGTLLVLGTSIVLHACFDSFHGIDDVILSILAIGIV